MSRGFEVFTTVRSSLKAGEFEEGVTAIGGVDSGAEGASADALEAGVKGHQFELVIYSAGYFTTDVSPS